MERRERIGEGKCKDSSEPTSPTKTLSRWSSDPTSLSSDADETAGRELLERTRRSVATIQYTLEAERERSRRLEIQLEWERIQTLAPAPSTMEMVFRCVDQERSDSRKLHGVVLRQHKTIAKLRRQLRQLRPRPTVDSSSGSSGDSEDRDDSLSENFEMVSVRPGCSCCSAADNSHKTVIITATTVASSESNLAIAASDE